MNKLISVIKSSWMKWCVAVLAFTCLFSMVDLQAVCATFKHASFFNIIFFLYVSVVLVYVSAMKWQLFIEEDGKRKISVFKLFNYYILGYFINLIVPAYVGGDTVRSLYAGKDIGNKHQALAATFLERYTGVVAMLVLALLFMWHVKVVTFNIKMAIIVIAFFTCLAIYFLLQEKLLFLIEKLCPIFKKISPHCFKVQAALRYAHTKPLLLIKAFFYSFLFHICAVINVLAAASCIGWESVPYQDLFVVLPIIFLIGFVPISPNGLGIQEGAYFYFLHALGATTDEALAVALVLRIKLYILAVCGGLIWMYFNFINGNKQNGMNS